MTLLTLENHPGGFMHLYDVLRNGPIWSAVKVTPAAYGRLLAASPFVSISVGAGDLRLTESGRLRYNDIESDELIIYDVPDGGTFIGSLDMVPNGVCYAGEHAPETYAGCHYINEPGLFWWYLKSLLGQRAKNILVYYRGNDGFPIPTQLDGLRDYQRAYFSNPLYIGFYENTVSAPNMDNLADVPHGCPTRTNIIFTPDDVTSSMAMHFDVMVNFKRSTDPRYRWFVTIDSKTGGKQQ